MFPEACMRQAEAMEDRIHVGERCTDRDGAPEARVSARGERSSLAEGGAGHGVGEKDGHERK